MGNCVKQGKAPPKENATRPPMEKRDQPEDNQLNEQGGPAAKREDAPPEDPPAE